MLGSDYRKLALKAGGIAASLISNGAGLIEGYYVYRNYFLIAVVANEIDAVSQFEFKDWWNLADENVVLLTVYIQRQSNEIHYFTNLFSSLFSS